LGLQAGSETLGIQREAQRLLIECSDEAMAPMAPDETFAALKNARVDRGRAFVGLDCLARHFRSAFITPQLRYHEETQFGRTWCGEQFIWRVLTATPQSCRLVAI
jgi:hypothetical protein